MRINTRNISGLLLVALLVCTNLSGCLSNTGVSQESGETSSVPTDSTSSSSTGNSADSSDVSGETMTWDGPAGYTIVYPAGDKNAATAAERLSAYWKKTAGAALAVQEDSAAPTEKEILLGRTNREESTRDLPVNRYALRLQGQKLVLDAGHYLGLDKAVYRLSHGAYADGKISTFEETFDFEDTKLNGYTYVWGDEFDTDVLDASKWGLEARMEGTAELQLLEDNPDVLLVEDSLLKLRAIHYYDPTDPTVEYAASPSVLTRETMSFQYGYLEMRARVPYLPGAWPSLWMLGGNTLGPEQSSNYHMEVDIFEIFSSSNTATPNIHKWYDNGEHSQYQGLADITPYVFAQTSGLKDEFHIYGFEWTPDAMRMYIDGECYMTFDLTENFDGKSDMKGFHDPAYLILNNHLFTESSTFKPYDGCEIDNVNLPVEYDVDWIRLYQKPSEGTVYTVQ